ncbi:MAG: hypothetical protein KatS3mg058_1372 [Roseiflexus sp.]|nr:MAG: hypothetical protein KatS3mg058_1372 [Roseiflexus sp.]
MLNVEDEASPEVGGVQMECGDTRQFHVAR